MIIFCHCTHVNVPPIATLSFISHRDITRPEAITFEGRGSDGDSTNIIVAYEWTIGDRLLSHEPAFTLPASQLPLGLHTITYRVQDDEGNWSAPQTQKILIRDENGAGGN